MFRMWLASLVLVAAAQQARAEELKPVVVVSFPSYDELLSDIDYLGQLAGQPQASQQVEALLAAFTQGQGFAGLDKAKACGMALFLDAGQPAGVLFMPVTDVKKLLSGLEAFVGVAEESKDHKGLLELSIQGQTIFVKSANGWAWVSNSPELLGKVPAKPAWIAPLAKEYDFAVQLRIQNIPEFYRQLAIQALREGARSGLEAAPPEVRELQKKMVQVQLKQLEDMFNSLDRITLGCRVDGKAKRLVLGGSVTLLPDSPYGRMFKEYQAIPTRLTAFSPAGAILRVQSAVKFGDAVRAYTREQLKQTQLFFEQLSGQIPEGDPRAQGLKHVLPFLRGYFRFIGRLVEAESLDFACGVENQDGHLFFALALRAPGGPDFQQLTTRGLEKLAEKTQGKVKVRIGAAEQNGVTFHEVTAGELDEKGQQGLEKAEKLLGQEPSLAVGASRSALYVAVGSQALKQLQQRVASSKAQQPSKLAHMGYCELALHPLADLVQKQAQDNPVVAAVAQLVPEKNDKIRMEADLIPNGERIDLIVEEGVLRAIINAVRTFGQGAAAAAPEF